MLSGYSNLNCRDASDPSHGQAYQPQHAHRVSMNAIAWTCLGRRKLAAHESREFRSRIFGRLRQLEWPVRV